MFIPDRTRPIIEQLKQGMGFGTNHTDSTVADITYIGHEDSDGVWIIQKIDSTVSNTSTITYASIKNNSSYTSYIDAWSNRATMTYGLYSEAY